MKERLGNTMNQESKKLRMMLIDAEEGIAERFQVYLSDHPEVELVKIITNGNEVVQAIKEYIPDIIIMDLLLPNGDGLSLLENLSQIQLTKEPFIIITSSITLGTTVNYSFDLGVDYYIMKPYDIEHVVRRIEHILKDGTKIRKESERIEERVSSEHALLQEVTKVLLELGMPTNVKGYQYLRDGILLAIEDISMLHYITKSVYPSIAEKYDATPGSVERAIRNAIEICFTRTRGDVLYKMFGNAIDVDKGKVTNSEFIGLIADKVRIQHQMHG